MAERQPSIGDIMAEHNAIEARQVADAMFCDVAVENIRVMLAASVECGLVPECVEIDLETGAIAVDFARVTVQ